MKRILVLFCCFSFIDILYSQIVYQWTKSYTAESYCLYLNIADDSGNVYTAGGTGPAANSDFLLIKYDSTGNQKWLKTYNGPGNRNDFIKCITRDKFGFIYISGESGKADGDAEYCTQKYNAAGTLMWTSRFNSYFDFDNKPVAIGIDYTGNVYVTGKCAESGNHPRPYQFVTVKYDENGVLLWQQYYGTIGANDEPVAMVVDSAGNCLVTGRTNRINGLFGIAVIKYSPSGSILWQNEIQPAGSSEREPFLMKQDKNNNIYISAIIEDSLSSFNYRYYTIKYNSSGTILWDKVYRKQNINTSVFPYALLIDNTGNVYVSGTEYAGTLNAVTVKYDAAGNQLWDNTYDTGGDESISDGAFDIYGNIILTGSIKTSASSPNDILIISYNSQRTTMFTFHNVTPANDFGKMLSINKYNNLFITGYDSSASYDILTMKYKMDGNVGVNINNTEIPAQFILSQNYPNPFNPGTIISYQLPKSSHIRLSIFDMTGKEVTTLIDGNQNAGSYNIAWDASGHASGVYFYKLTADNFTDVKKMILIK